MARFVAQRLGCGLSVRASYTSMIAVHSLFCRKGNVRLLEILIRSGADVNLPAHHRMSPLHIAAWHGRTRAVQCLVNAGQYTAGGGAGE